MSFAGRPPAWAIYLSIIRAHCRPIQIIHDQTHQVPARFLDRLLAGRGRRHRALLRLLPACADRLLRAQGQLLQPRHQSPLLHARALQHGRGVLLHPLPEHQAVPHRQPRDRHQQEPAETGSHLLALLPVRNQRDRLDPSKIYSLYQASGYDYAKTLTASANVLPPTLRISSPGPS